MSDSLSDTTKAKLDGALTLVVKFQHQRNALQAKVYELTAENKQLNTDLRIALSVQNANGFKLALEAKAEELTGLLRAAKCPCCDGSGAYYDNMGEVCQCQWCYETKAALKQESE